MENTAYKSLIKTTVDVILSDAGDALTDVMFLQWLRKELKHSSNTDCYSELLVQLQRLYDNGGEGCKKLIMEMTDGFEPTEIE